MGGDKPRHLAGQFVTIAPFSISFTHTDDRRRIDRAGLMGSHSLARSCPVAETRSGASLFLEMPALTQRACGDGSAFFRIARLLTFGY
jgi:hypothetical protein